MYQMQSTYQRRCLLIGFSPESVFALKQSADPSWLIETSTSLKLPNAYLVDLILLESSFYFNNRSGSAGQVPIVGLQGSRLGDASFDLWDVYKRAVGEISPFVGTDGGAIRVLLVYRPRSELSSITKENFHDHLFYCEPDEISLRREYDVFIESMRIESEGPIVLDIGDCVFDILYRMDSALASHFLSLIGIRESSLVFDDATSIYSQASNLTDAILSGKILGGAPFTNLMYTRDPLFVCGGTVFLGKMRWPVRQIEPDLLRAIFQCHPFFSSVSEKLVDPISALGSTGEMFIEGGDVLNIGDGVFILGSGERTNIVGQRWLCQELLQRGIASTVVCVVGEECKGFFHLDTVISVVSTGLVLCIKDQLNRCLDVIVCKLGHCGAVIENSISRMTIGELLRSLGVEVLMVEEDLEALTSDAVNLVCCRSNVLIGFQHNLRFYNSLSEQGLRVVPVHVDALWAGRGGPRCLTMPLVRTFK